MTTKPTPWLLCCVLTTGCIADIDDGSDDNVATAQTAQAISGLWVSSWGTAGNSGPDLDLGSDANQTCFLTGVRGSLKGYDGANGAQDTAKVGVYQSGGHWWLKTRAGGGSGVVGTVACVPYASHRISIGLSEIGPWSSNFADRPDRQCFVTDLYSSGHGWDAGLSSYPGESPAAFITHNTSTGTWDVTGQWNPNSDGSNSGGVGGICFDIPTTQGWTQTIVADNGAHLTGVLTNGAGEKISWNDGWVCGMRGVEGVFMDSWNDPGAELFLNSNNRWAYDIQDDGIGSHRELKIHCMK